MYKVGDELVDSTEPSYRYRITQVTMDRYKVWCYLSKGEHYTWYDEEELKDLRKLTKLEKALK